MGTSTFPHTEEIKLLRDIIDSLYKGGIYHTGKLQDNPSISYIKWVFIQRLGEIVSRDVEVELGREVSKILREEKAKK